MIRIVALISINVPINRNRILIIKRKPPLVEMDCVMRFERKPETPVSVITFPAITEKAFNNPITAVDAPLIAAMVRKSTLIAFLFTNHKIR